MRQAVELQPYMMDCASEDMQQNVDLLVTAFANSQEYTSSYYSTRVARAHPGDQGAHMATARAYWMPYLRRWRLNTLLPRRLSIFVETANVYKLRLADLLGVLRGEKLDLYRRCLC
jgi:hypothetical protein